MKKSSSYYCHKASEKGSIAILTLWAVVFLALLAGIIGGEVIDAMRVASGVKRLVQGDAIAGRVYEDVRSRIMIDTVKGVDPLFQAWAKEENEFTDDTYKISFELLDEDQKININKASPAIISRLLQILGEMPPPDAEEMAIYITDWRDADMIRYGGEGGMDEKCSRMMEPPYSCKNKDLEALEELWWVPGMTKELFDRISGSLALYGIGRVNLNTAGVDVLKVLGLSGGAAEALASWRNESGHYFESEGKIIGDIEKLNMAPADKEALQKLITSGSLGVRSDDYRGIVSADLDSRHRTKFSFVVNRNGELKSWKE